MARIPTANFDTGNDTHPGKFRAILIRAAQEEVISTDDYSRSIVVTAAVTMVPRSRRARSGGRPVSKPVPFPLSAPGIAEFRGFAKPGNYRFAMRFSMFVFLQSK